MPINPDIRDQAYQFFMEEAPDLLQVIETGLLTLSANRSTANVHNLMRAAHSIKGGAASVDLDAIATLAHRLENIFKALYSEDLELDSDLESQLLQAYDCLRLPLLEQITVGHLDAEQTLALADPIFTQIEERLGDALIQTNNYIPSSSDLGMNMALAIFEVDVAQGVEHLAAVVANPQNYEVAGELRAQAEVFTGFAMLLDLPGFGAIAQTALAALSAHPNRALEITQLALADFQAAREAVLRGDDTKGGSASEALLAFATGEWGLSNSESSVGIKDNEGWEQESDFNEIWEQVSLESPPIPLSPSPSSSPSPIPTATGQAIEELYTSIPLIEDVFGTPVAASETQFDDSPILAETPLSIGEQLNQTSEPDSELDPFATQDIAPIASPALISPEVIDMEFATEATSVRDDLAQEIPLLEEVFGSASHIPEIEVSASNAIIPLTPTANEFQHQQEEQVDSQDAPVTLEAAVQSIEQLFENLPSIEDSPEVVTGSFVDTPKRKVEKAQRATEESVTPKLTLRVELDRLERMNNLVGELTINRNSLSLQNEQLQGSVRDVLHRFARFRNKVKQLRELSDKMLIGASSSGSIASHPSFLSIVGDRWLVGKGKIGDRVKRSDGDTERASALLSVHLENPKGSADRETSDSGQLSVEKTHFDSLEMDSYSILNSRLQAVLEEMAQLEESVDDIALFARATNQTLDQQRQMQLQLRDELMWARMLPLGEVLNRFPRLLRDLSNTYNKPVSLKLNGTGVLVDRAVLEKLYDPLVHLLRNAFDHGIEPPDIRRKLGKSEQGHIEISAYHKGSKTIIEVSDDGKGIQPELIRKRALERGWFSQEQLSKFNDADLMELIFEPGFSTAHQVTELSGRGVGLDVVREQLRSLKGTVNLTSSVGMGTTFTLHLPLTLTIAKLLICTVGASTLAFPSDNIEEIVVPNSEQIKRSGTKQFLLWREQIVPIYRVADLLDYSCPLPDTQPSKALQAVPSPEDWELPMLVFKQGQQAFALEIENLLAEQELVLKPFGAAIAPPTYTYGCTILGDGSLIPVIDGTALLEYSLGEGTGDWEKKTRRVEELSPLTPSPHHPLSSSEYPQNQALSPKTTNTAELALPTILVVDDAIALRRTLALTLETAGYRVLQARDGQEAIEQLQKNLSDRGQGVATPSTKLVICDIEMPNMNGFDFLNYRRQDPQLSTIPVIMLTSRSNNKHRWLAMHLGATAYFTKPYIERDFLKAIKDLIHSH
jgi:chemotaxis family two-component system sensor histidine kinase/response regulator PixL